MVLYWTQLFIGSNSIAIDITNRSSKYPGQHLSAVLVTDRTRPPPTQAEQAKRRRFLQNLSVLEGVSLCNDVDNDSPPTDFRFIKQCVLGAGVHRATEEVMTGCECHKVHRQAKGCVYLDTCSCIQDSGVNDLGTSFSWNHLNSYSYRNILNVFGQGKRFFPMVWMGTRGSYGRWYSRLETTFTNVMRAAIAPPIAGTEWCSMGDKSSSRSSRRSTGAGVFQVLFLNLNHLGSNESVRSPVQTRSPTGRIYRYVPWRDHHVR